MALASPSRLAPRLALPPARPASQLTVPGAAARPPRRCSYHRLAVLVLWEGRTTSAWRARLLLGGFSDAGVSESDDDDDEEEDALRAGGPGAYVLGLGQAMGTSSTLSYDPDLANLVSKTNLLVVEGYLFELLHTIEAIKKACEDAHKNGALIAVTASHVSCIKRCFNDFWDIVGNYADILFGNAKEATAFCELSSTDSPMSATRYLSHSVPVVSVTDGAHGSYIGVKGEAIYIPPPPCDPIDTCGAGDAYASGILYSVLRGASDLKGIGLLASQVAAVVVGQQGTRLWVQDADRLTESFALHLDSLEFCSDV